MAGGYFDESSLFDRRVPGILGVARFLSNLFKP